MEKTDLPKVSERELEVIRKYFKGNEPLLKSIRALMFGLETSQAEKDLIAATFADNELYQIFERRFYPTLSKDTPIGQVQDVWLGVEQMVFSQSRDTITQALQYKENALKMTRYALDLLRNPNNTPPEVSFSATQADPLAVDLLARNQYIRHIEQQLLFLWVIAEQKVTTPSKPQSDR